MVDAHVHIDQYEQATLDQVIGQIEDHRITTLCVATDQDSYTRTCEIALRSDLLIPAFGIHPWYAHRADLHSRETEISLARSPVIGEAGLDHCWVDDDDGQYERQKQVFTYLCEYAAAERKPMNIHTKGAERQVLDILRSVGNDQVTVHWYSGPITLLRGYLDAGCFFTLGVELLQSPLIREVLRYLPADRILLETDNPGGYQWLYGRIGMPDDIFPVCAEAARIRGVDIEAFTEQLQLNWRASLQGVEL
ncbi:MAG: TatD family hydrolase [Spirochaetia bacterium]|nr:TatD family hydrolase [Spirochaetia bacterium]MCF7940765.1 TatD family hydrolase [Spirochaetia bacterium]